MFALLGREGANVNLNFEGLVPPNETRTVLDHTVPLLETWRLTLLTIRHHMDDPTPGTLVAKIWVHSGGQDRELMTISGEDTFFRLPLYTVLEEGDRLTMDVTARHHEDDCVFDGYVSFERRSMTDGGVLRVLAINKPEHYLHFQGVPAAVWTINHDLGFFPGGVTVVDSGGGVQIGRVDYINTNTLTVSFFVGGNPVAFSGSAFLS
jgi:hypothetical protein